MRKQDRWTRSEMLLAAILIMATCCASIQATAFFQVYQAINRVQNQMKSIGQIEEFETPSYEFGN